MDVRETVLTAMRTNGLAGYENRANPVITALESREQEACEQLIEFAVQQGLNRQEAERALITAGLTVRTAEANERDDAIAAMERQIEEMQRTLRDLRG